MALESGTRLGPYEILASLGAGGMGEVYRARDSRLERMVAIKVLPGFLADDPALRLRFEREAKTISSLAHPHICTVHDVGSENGVDFLVMEHLEGETLDERIRLGPLPLADVLRYGIEIADALEKAHRQGVIHRDVKPSNIMLTKSGAKLLDFGLARNSSPLAAGNASRTSGSHASQPPDGETLLKSLTQEGTIVGTFQYMAPEQLEGRDADPRTDIFAFGALLYEMLTGRRAFSGKSRASLIAAILATEPAPVSTLRDLTPPALDRVVRICLEKDPDDRWQSMHDLKLELEGIRADPARSTGRAVPAARIRRAIPWLLFGAALVALTIVTAIAVTRDTGPSAPLKVQIMPPEGMRFNTEDAPAVLSPDATRIAVRLNQAGGTEPDRLWIRRLDSLEMRPLAETERAWDVFWSPDGRQIGFFTEKGLKRIDAAGGPVASVCASGDSRGGTWVDGDTILLATGPNGPISKVSLSGGALQPVTRLDSSRGEIGHWRPFILPDRRHFLFTSINSNRENSGVFVGSLDSFETTKVLSVSSTAIYVDPGYLLYAFDGSLYGQKFDAGRLETSGAPFVIATNISYVARWGSPGYSAAPGMIAYHQRGAESEIRISKFDLEGKPLGDLDIAGGNLDLSRDDGRLAVQRLDVANQSSSIWTYDLNRGVGSRITFRTDPEIGPVWSPDGKYIAYVVPEGLGFKLLRRLSNGAGGEETLLESSDALEAVDWSRDGRYILLERRAQSGGQRDLAGIDLQSKKRELFPIVAGPFREFSGRFSPDGRWLSYGSDESGQDEIYVQRFPPDGSKWQISSGGGTDARWRGDSRELYYIARNHMLMSVAVGSGSEFRPDIPKPLMQMPANDYVVTSDGREIIVAQEHSSNPQPLTLIANWKGSP